MSKVKITVSQTSIGRTYLIDDIARQMSEDQIIEMNLRLLKAYNGRAHVDCRGIVLPTRNSEDDATAVRMFEAVLGCTVELHS